MLSPHDSMLTVHTLKGIQQGFFLSFQDFTIFKHFVLNTVRMNKSQCLGFCGMNKGLGFYVVKTILFTSHKHVNVHIHNLKSTFAAAGLTESHLKLFLLMKRLPSHVYVHLYN